MKACQTSASEREACLNRGASSRSSISGIDQESARGDEAAASSSQQHQMHVKELVEQLMQLCPSGKVSSEFLEHVLMDQFKGCLEEAAEFLIEAQDLPERDASFLRIRQDMLEEQREEQRALELSRKAIVAR